MDNVLQFAEQYKADIKELNSIERAIEDLETTPRVGISGSMAEIVLIGNQRVVARLKPRWLDIGKMFRFALEDRRHELLDKIEESEPMAKALGAVIDLERG